MNMQILHMDVPQCEAMVAELGRIKNDLQAQLSTLSASVDNVVNSQWIAPGALKFQQEFRQWQTQITAIITELDNYQSTLSLEIEEWKRMAANIQLNLGAGN